MEFTFKKCTLEDVLELQELSIQTYRETFEAHNTEENMKEYLDRAYETQCLKAEIADPNVNYLFLQKGSETVGYIRLNRAPSQSDINDEKSLEIQRIYVLKKFKGQGAGSVLMQRAIEEAQKLQKEYIWLGVWEKNEKALEFYNKKGFKNIGVHTFVMGDDAQSDYIMRLDV